LVRAEPIFKAPVVTVWSWAGYRRAHRRCDRRKIGRAGLRRRASTVTGGSGLVPGSTEGVAGVVCGSGVSDAGGVVVCGVASLMPPQQTHSVIASAASA
jgi:hypothetical protein